MLTQEQMSALVSELGRNVYDGVSPDVAFARLNDYWVTSADVERLKTLSVTMLTEALSTESLKRIFAFPHATAISSAINTQDRVSVGKWAEILFAVEVITEQERDSLLGILQDTETVSVETRHVPHMHDAECLARVSGAPNVFDRSDFDAAYAEARGQ